MTSLRTDRLLLRRPMIADARDALAMLRDPEVGRWNPAPTVVDLDAAVERCERAGDWSGGDHLSWHGVDPSTGRLVLNLSLFALDTTQATAKVGYRVAPQFRRRRYAGEALRAVTAWALDEGGLARIQLEHTLGNVASCRLAEGCGYRFEGTLREAYRTPDGARHDDHVHGRLHRGDPDRRETGVRGAV